MISIETMKFRTAEMIGDEFPLVFWRGKGRIVGVGRRQPVAARPRRARRLTWDRLTITWKRFLSNHTLTVDELGGGADAVGIVSLFAAAAGRRLSTCSTPTACWCSRSRDDTPVHQYADMSRPTSWAPWRRKIHGD